MIRLDGISSGYGKKEVISALSADIVRGRLTVIIGPNGCGKSTLLKSMAGIIPIMSGEIRIDGKCMSSMKRGDIAKRIAYLPQGRDMPDMTVSQIVLHGRFPHLSYPRRYRASDIETARRSMERMGILHLSCEPLKQLSGGVRQSAYIAMALAQETDCILFDEPSTYLDISHSLSLMKQMKELASEGRAIVAVMHDMTMALEFADEVILMNEGRIVMQGSPQSVAESGLIGEIFGVDLEDAGRGYVYKYDSDTRLVGSGLR